MENSDLSNKTWKELSERCPFSCTVCDPDAEEDFVEGDLKFEEGNINHIFEHRNKS